MLRLDKLTVKAQEALASAQDLAAEHGHQQIEPLHLLLALTRQEEGVVPELLAKLGAHADALARDAERRLAELPRVSGAAQLYLSTASDEVLRNAFDEASRLKDHYVSTEHLMLAIANQSGSAAGESAMTPSAER